MLPTTDYHATCYYWKKQCLLLIRLGKNTLLLRFFILSLSSPDFTLLGNKEAQM
jgi:hypothetical protein